MNCIKMLAAHERALSRPPGESTRGEEKEGLTEGESSLRPVGCRTPKIYDRSPPLQTGT